MARPSALLLRQLQGSVDNTLKVSYLKSPDMFSNWLRATKSQQKGNSERWLDDLIYLSYYETSWNPPYVLTDVWSNTDINVGWKMCFWQGQNREELLHTIYLQLLLYICHEWSFHGFRKCTQGMCSFNACLVSYLLHWKRIIHMSFAWLGSLLLLCKVPCQPSLWGYFCPDVDRKWDLH